MIALSGFTNIGTYIIIFTTALEGTGSICMLAWLGASLSNRRRTICRGYSHMMSAKNGGLQTPPPPYQQRSEIGLPPSPLSKNIKKNG